MKENGEPEFTLTAQDIQGVMIDEDGEEIPTIFYPKENRKVAIRKLTPREYFRLQGWDDEYFDRAEFVNTQTQLYKQAGNGVTVPVIKAMAEKMKVNKPEK